ncbi:MAG: hypothetical protein JWN17_2455 [Frankiales bacterium]|nr:hypothetical protein [Frankiales bacterium]
MLHALVSLVLPAGGQQRARQNAWASMSEGAARARARREADAAMALAQLQVDVPRAAVGR